MPKIKLNGELHISTELLQCLINRGVFTNCSDPGEDFFCYLHECITRDNQVPPMMQADIDVAVTPETSMIVQEQQSISVPIAQTEAVNNAVTKKNKEDLACSLAELYRR